MIGEASFALEEGVDVDDLPWEEQVTIVRALEVTFDGVPGNLQSVDLAVGIDSTRWVSASLVAVLHATSGWEPRTEIRIDAAPVVLDPDDPATVFVGPIFGQVVFSGLNDVAPTMRVETISPLAGQLRIQLGLIQDGDGPQTATISVYLVGRFHAPRD